MAPAPVPLAASLPGAGEFARLRDGFCHYRLDGPPRGRPLLLLHGATVPAWQFDRLVPHLARAGRRVIRPDLFGHGYSDRPRCSHGYPLFLRQVVQLLEYLEVAEPVDLLGHSLGAAVAARLALADPGRFGAVAMAAPLLDFHSRQRAAALLRVPLLGELVTHAYVVPMLMRRRSRRYRPIEDGRFVAMFRDQLRLPGFGRALLSLVRSGALADQSACYRALGAQDRRVLVLRGGDDPLVPAAQFAALRRLLPHARFIEVAGTAHAMLLTDPARVAAPLLAFLAGRPEPASLPDREPV